ncbi:relaxase MobL [Leuconostoc citreum]|uniref:MobP2 family relaxase n=1 Tax=Leuconostoc citreum TaxID=33964 RepID=UPI00200AFB8E|nr:MobP2 family relaxase [Leuconostoc citreum]MCK8605705.1 relaxase MobL [Leuconostoc citreum]
MAKTGKLAAFKLGEKNTAMVNLPAQFVTASEANSKGFRYSKLVDYSLDPDKVNDFNNAAIPELMDLRAQFNEDAYATRRSATTEQEPIFSGDKLHYNNHDISMLRQRLDKAQENGNNVHELAFSLRGDWLVKNKLYDPETGNIDQNRLKHAEQEIAKTLINKGFNSPLGETEKDVVWFGVIHQDTDHLNMHLWFAKVSKETRPEMIKQTGPYKGQPVGVIPLETIDLAKRQFRKQLMTNAENQKRVNVLKSIGELRKEIITNSEAYLVNDQHVSQLKAIYQALPQKQKGRWQVGNSTLTATNTKMSAANHLTNDLLNDVFAHELKSEYQDFKALGQRFDAFNIEDQGVMRKGQTKLSENKDAELRKRLANQLYRYLGEIDDNELKLMSQRVNKIKDKSIEPKADLKEKNFSPLPENQQHQTQHDMNGFLNKIPDKKASSSLTKDRPKTGLKGNNYPPTSPSPQHNVNHHVGKTLYQISAKGVAGSLNKVTSSSDTPQEYIPVRKTNQTMNKISRLWQQDIRADVRAERAFLQNQKRVARERQVEEAEVEYHRGL